MQTSTGPRDVYEACQSALQKGDQLANIPAKGPPMALLSLASIQTELTTRYPIGWSMVWSEQTPQGTIETKAMATGSRVEQLGQAVFLDMAVRANTPMRP